MELERVAPTIVVNLKSCLTKPLQLSTGGPQNATGTQPPASDCSISGNGGVGEGTVSTGTCASYKKGVDDSDAVTSRKHGRAVIAGNRYSVPLLLSWCGAQTDTEPTRSAELASGSRASCDEDDSSCRNHGRGTTGVVHAWLKRGGRMTRQWNVAAPF